MGRTKITVAVNRAVSKTLTIDLGRRRKLSAALQEAIEGLALKRPPLSIRVVCNQAKLLADRLGEEAPTYDLVYDVVSRLPADLPKVIEGASQLSRKVHGFLAENELRFLGTLAGCTPASGAIVEIGSFRLAKIVPDVPRLIAA